MRVEQMDWTKGFVFAAVLGVTLSGCSKGETATAKGSEQGQATAVNGAPNAASGGTSGAMTPPEGSRTVKEGSSAPTFAKPEIVRGIYVTAWTAGGTKKMNAMLAKTKTSQINAFVIDIRDDGEMYFKTGIPLAKEARAEKIAVSDGPKLMTRLKEAGVYPIARIACYRDAFVPRRMPERAVQVASGQPWRDHSGHTWLDPYNKKNWEYLFATIDYAMDLGFPEIQLDYVRFPSEGKAQSQRFPGKKSYPDAKATPSSVITEFCNEVSKRTKARGVVVSADIFGIISSGTKDQGIGQTLEMIVEPFDVICPMVYPSHYARGEYGIAHPNASPYAIIDKAMGDFKRRAPKKAMRPWLQDFSLGVRYGEKQVRAQIDASAKHGYKEYLLWNASNRYTWSALTKPKSTPKVATRL